MDEASIPAAASAEVMRKLDRAVACRGLFRVDRSIRGAEAIKGFVIGASSAWTLLAPCRDVLLDGYTAVRTRDVTRIKQRGDEDSLTIRALRRRGQWPVAGPRGGVHLENLGKLLTAAARHYSLLGVSTERRAADELWIGALAGLRRKSLGLHLIDPEAHWHDAPSTFRRKHIARVDFGGRYEQILREFAPPRP